MEKIETYSIDKYRQIFIQPETSRDFFIVEVKQYPDIEEPYRAESYAVGFLKKGSIEMQAGLKKETVTAPAIIAMGPSVIRSFRNASSDMEMDIIFFKGSFFLENQANVFFLTKFTFFENTDQHNRKLNAAQATLFATSFTLIKDTFNRKNKHYASIVRSYLYALIYELDVLVDDNQQTDAQLNPLFEKFRQLLSKEFLRHRSVGFYADNLNVTRKYLSEVIKKHTGKNASDWIDEVVVLEAKVLLQNKWLTINQISDQLNFSNQSVFGKFFKTAAGLSPLDYRKKF